MWWKQLGQKPERIVSGSDKADLGAALFHGIGLKRRTFIIAVAGMGLPKSVHIESIERFSPDRSADDFLIFGKPVEDPQVRLQITYNTETREGTVQTV
jgi:hypothetical protein